MGKSYRVIYEMDEDYWSAKIEGDVNGCLVITQGKTIEQAKERIREALAVALEDDQAAADAELVGEIVEDFVDG